MSTGWLLLSHRGGKTHSLRPSARQAVMKGKVESLPSTGHIIFRGVDAHFLEE